MLVSIIVPSAGYLALVQDIINIDPIPVVLEYLHEIIALNTKAHRM